MNSPPTLLSKLLIFTVRACVSSVFCKTCSHVTVLRTVFEAVQCSSSLYSVSFISSCFIPNEIPIQSQSSHLPAQPTVSDFRAVLFICQVWSKVLGTVELLLIVCEYEYGGGQYWVQVQGGTWYILVVENLEGFMHHTYDII